MNIQGNSTEEVIPVNPRRFLLDDRVPGLYDLMYTLLPLEPGEILSVPVFYPEELEAVDLAIEVSNDTDTVEMAGRNLIVYVCDVGSPTQVHYVTREGQLVKVERPYENVTIKLIEAGIVE